MITDEDVLRRRKQLRKKKRIIYNDDGAAIAYYRSVNGYPITAATWLGTRFAPLCGDSSSPYPDVTKSDFTTYVFNTGYPAWTLHRSEIPKMALTSPYTSSEYHPTNPWDASEDIYNTTGKDALQIAGEYFLGKDVEFLYEFRVNDSHDASFSREQLSSLPLKQDLWDSGGLLDNGKLNALNYEHEDAFNLALDTVLEVIYNNEKWPVDGVYLRFYRTLGYFTNVTNTFNRGATTQSQIDRMTSWISQINDAIIEVSKTRMENGKEPLLLFVNIPDHPEYSKILGLDTEAWMRDGLVDVIIPADSHQFKTIKDSVELGGRYGVGVCYELQDSRFAPLRHRNTAEGIAGRAKQIWGAGCDGFEVFNFNYAGGASDPLGPSAKIWRNLEGDKLNSLPRVYYQDWANGYGCKPSTAGVLPYPGFFPSDYITVNPSNWWDGKGTVYIDVYEDAEPVINVYCKGVLSDLLVNGVSLPLSTTPDGYTSVIPSGVLLQGANAIQVEGSAVITDLEVIPSL